MLREHIDEMREVDIIIDAKIPLLQGILAWVDQ